MHNWSVDESTFKKNHPRKYQLWRLTQLINYGLDGEKLSKSKVKKVWPNIKDKLDPNTKVYFEFLLWGKRPSSNRITKDFWKLS